MDLASLDLEIGRIWDPIFGNLPTPKVLNIDDYLEDPEMSLEYPDECYHEEPMPCTVLKVWPHEKPQKKSSRMSECTDPILRANRMCYRGAPSSILFREASSIREQVEAYGDLVGRAKWRRPSEECLDECCAAVDKKDLRKIYDSHPQDEGRIYVDRQQISIRGGFLPASERYAIYFGSSSPQSAQYKVLVCGRTARLDECIKLSLSDGCIHCSGELGTYHLSPECLDHKLLAGMCCNQLVEGPNEGRYMYQDRYGGRELYQFPRGKSIIVVDITVSDMALDNILSRNITRAIRRLLPSSDVRQICSNVEVAGVKHYIVEIEYEADTEEGGNSFKLTSTHSFYPPEVNCTPSTPLIMPRVTNDGFSWYSMNEDSIDVLYACGVPFGMIDHVDQLIRDVESECRKASHSIQHGHKPTLSHVTIHNTFLPPESNDIQVYEDMLERIAEKHGDGLIPIGNYRKFTNVGLIKKSWSMFCERDQFSPETTQYVSGQLLGKIQLSRDLLKLDKTFLRDPSHPKSFLSNVLAVKWRVIDFGDGDTTSRRWKEVKNTKELDGTPDCDLYNVN